MINVICRLEDLRDLSLAFGVSFLPGGHRLGNPQGGDGVTGSLSGNSREQAVQQYVWA